MNNENSELDKISENEKINEKVSEKSITKKEDFDIADFIVKHYDKNYSVRKKSKFPMIISIVLAVAVLFGLLALAAVSFKNKNSIKGEWISDKGIHMEIIEDYITIEKSSMKYVLEKDNIISLNVGGEYFKIIYVLNNDNLKFIFPNGSEVNELNYKRVN